MGFLALTPPENAQDLSASCAGAEVRSIDLSKETDPVWPLNTGPEIRVTRTAAETDVSVTAYGPILSSADSPDVKVKIACIADGFRVEATLVHFGNGSLLKNLLWRPQIHLNLLLHQPRVVMQAVWKMQNPSGRELKRVQTPPYPEQKYPITLTETLRASSAEKRKDEAQRLPKANAAGTTRNLWTRQISWFVV